MIRLAHAHGLKVQTFNRLLIGSEFHLWNRDIDRQAPAWLIEILCRNTGTPIERGNGTALKSYEGILFREYHESYILKWILPVKSYHRTRTGHGQQFCPHCLAKDAEPYFRKRWRVAFYTWCTQHKIMLHDRCPACSSPVVFHRQELGKPKEIDAGSMALCHACGFDLRYASAVPPIFYDESAHATFEQTARLLEPEAPWQKPQHLGYNEVMHQLLWLMSAQYRKARLHEFACRQLGVPVPQLDSEMRTLESRSIEERHHLTQLGFWFMADLETRLTAAWLDGAVTYSALLRDFGERPEWFDTVVEKFYDWRSRPNRHVQPQGENGRFISRCG